MPVDAHRKIDCALIADVDAGPRDADQGSGDWRLPAVERLHAALAFIAVIAV